MQFRFGLSQNTVLPFDNQMFIVHDGVLTYGAPLCFADTRSSDPNDSAEGGPTGGEAPRRPQNREGGGGGSLASHLFWTAVVVAGVAVIIALPLLSLDSEPRL
jgi:hypothetical protein